MEIFDPKIWQQKAGIEFDLLTWYAVHGHLCLALRQPQNIGPSRELIKKVLAEIGLLLLEAKLVNAEQLSEAYRIEQQESPHES